jgi:hypothetical protein
MLRRSDPMFQKILKLLTPSCDQLLTYKVVQSDYNSREAHTRLMSELNKWKQNECGVKVIDVKPYGSRVQAL